MSPIKLLDKYYKDNPKLYQVLLDHSRSVTRKALTIAAKHPELKLDCRFLAEASMLHDIGVFLTDAPGIYCYGKEPYIRHGILGAELLREEGYPRHARVCERHTGAGISLEDIRRGNLPLPYRSFLPETMEEKVICFADKFFSKSKLTKEKTVDQARRSIVARSALGAERFDKWCKLFL